MGKIIVSALGKAYKKYPTRGMRLAEAILPEYGPLHTSRWVLRNINFVVEPGEAIGIIGINGAGKSTLLKMLVGTIAPTEGSVSLTGKVAAMLELGMGFHPDFTGRQNIFMSGQLLGLKTHEITKLLPDIEAFAEIGEYIDQPVRIYSSGMQMRLAFSVATASRPDILIVDEALSVGDAYFQHKSFDRIRQFRALGTTLLLVSHEKAAIQSICDRAILLNAGRVELEDKPEYVMDYYNAMLADRENKSISQTPALGVTGTQTKSGSGEIGVTDISLIDSESQAIEVVRVGQAVSLRIIAKCNEAIDDLVVGYLIKDRLGQEIFGTNTFHCEYQFKPLVRGQIISLEFEFDVNLGAGSYSIAVALHAKENHIAKNYEWIDRAVVFNVINISNHGFVGSSWLPPRIKRLS